VQRTVAVINLKAICENAKLFKRVSKKLYAVVKADAYGHGAEEVVLALCGVADGFAVSIVEEGIEIATAACGKEILILTPPTDDREATAIVENGFSACVPDLKAVKLLVNAAKRSGKIAKIHLKVNTGMNRYGGDRYALKEVLAFICGEACVQVDGVFSHLYTDEKSVCEKQRKAFFKACEMVTLCYPKAVRHLSATYGAVLGERYAFDAVRVGLGLYGYLPYGLKLEDFPLKKAMQVYAKVVAVREYQGGGAGYGNLQSETEKDLFGAKLATLRFGYADGFLRQSRNGTVGAENSVNNLCMDACVRKNLQGLQVGELTPIMLDAEKTASATGGIVYETLCFATKRAETVYVYE
jgi:alanine racemase